MKCANVNVLPNEVVSNVDVLCALMELCCCGECDGSGVVKENFNRDLKWKWEFGEEVFKPEALLNDVDDRHVFRLGGGQGYRRLFFRHVLLQSLFSFFLHRSSNDSLLHWTNFSPSPADALCLNPASVTLRRAWLYFFLLMDVTFFPAYSGSKKCPNVCMFFTKVDNP